MRRLFNWLPFFHISCDEQFGEYARSFSLRYSLAAIVIARSKLYIVSVRAGSLKFFHLLRFDFVCPSPTQGDIDQKVDRYAASVASLSNEELALQYEYLKESYNNNEANKTSLETRVSSHLTSYFVLAGFYAYLFGELLKFPGGLRALSAWAAFATGGLFMVSAAAFLWSFLRVKAAVRSTFQELRTSSTLHTQARLAYTNWYATREENTVLVSQVKNAESNIILALALAAVLWLIVSVVQHEPIRAESDQPARSVAYEVINSDGTLDQSNAKLLLESARSAIGVKYASSYLVISAESPNPARDQIVSMLKLCVGSENVEDLRFEHGKEAGKSVIIQTREIAVEAIRP